MSTRPLYRIKSISEYHTIMGLPKPEHPLVSVIDLDSIPRLAAEGMGPINVMFDFYSITLKRQINDEVKLKYGRQSYDFNEGLMFFMSPGQVLGIEIEEGIASRPTGWLLLIHPDFLWHTPLAKAIKQYGFFDYSVYEALFLSDKEENTIIQLMQSIAQEYHSNIDKFSEGVIIAQLELLLTYSDRYYSRQFLTRKISNHQILSSLENVLTSYFTSDDLATKGIPTVQYVADQLHVSPNYLSGVLRSLTGQSTQQHIHDHLIDKAKERLSTTTLSVSEIAYGLGFEHSQSFSKLFKTKTNLSPLEFRHSFN